MKNLIKKIKKERWHLHAFWSGFFSLIILLFSKIEGNASNILLGLPFTWFVIGLFWEMFFYKEKNAKFSISDPIANAIGALIASSLFLLVYHLIF